MEWSDMTAQENTTISAKVKEMLDVAFNVSAGKKKREDAMAHLLVLASEEAGAQEIFKQGGISKIAQLVEGTEKAEEMEVICIAIRIVGKLCENNISRTEAVMKYSYNGKIGDNGMEICLEMINSGYIKRVNFASLYCLQNVLNTFSGMNDEPDSKPDEALCRLHKEKIDTILKWLLNNITNEGITGLARDVLIQFITRNIHYTTLNWAKQLVELDEGLHNLMEVASQLEDGIYKSSIDITCSTQTITYVCLAKIYENMYSADDKIEFLNAINEFIKNEFFNTTEDSENKPEIREESKIRIVVAMTTLPFDVETQIMTKEGFVEKIINFSKTDNILLQKLICEFIIASVNRFNADDRDDNWFTSGYLTIKGYLTILRDLLNSSEDDSILVRVFVGLCEMGKFSKLRCFYSLSIPRLFDCGKILKWLEICKRCLINRRAERDMRKWAVVGLSYLTFDTKVKNELIKNAQAVKAMIKLVKTPYLSEYEQEGLVILLVNLCSAYGEEAIIPETAEFAEYFDVKNYLRCKDSFGRERRLVLAEAGVTRALVSLAETVESQRFKQLIAHVFNVLSRQEDLREIVVEQGGTKTLLSLALDGTDKTKKHALQALVHLQALQALTIHPEIAFPGQMIMEVVRPIVNLLNSPENSVNEKCEILTALYNLASVNDSIREHIFNKMGFKKFDEYIPDSNYDILKLRSAQLLDNLTLCNAVASNEIFMMSDPHNYDKPNIIIRLWNILNKDTDKIPYKATAGHLVRATARFPPVSCNDLLSDAAYFHRFFHDKTYMESVKKFDTLPEFLHFLLANSNEDLQYRGIKITLNMMKKIEKDNAKLMEIGKIKERLRVLSENDNMENKDIKELASLALEAAAEWDENQRNVEGNEGTSQSTDMEIEHVD